MLDVIGAGATATSKHDWRQIWTNSDEARQLQQELDTIHSEGRNRPPVETIFHSEFTTPWVYQVAELWKRSAVSHWRDPSYLFAKLALNTFGGLFIGFTFFHSKDSQQGTQNKLFVRLSSPPCPFIYSSAMFYRLFSCRPFLGMIYLRLHHFARTNAASARSSVALVNQLQVPYIAMRAIYEVRERPSRMYSWTALLTSYLMVELPWNVVGSTLFFVCWYWTIGFDSSRAGYTYLMTGVLFPVYFSSFGLVRRIS